MWRSPRTRSFFSTCKSVIKIRKFHVLSPTWIIFAFSKEKKHTTTNEEKKKFLNYRITLLRYLFHTQSCMHRHTFTIECVLFTLLYALSRYHQHKWIYGMLVSFTVISSVSIWILLDWMNETRRRTNFILYFIPFLSSYTFSRKTSTGSTLGQTKWPFFFHSMSHSQFFWIAIIMIIIYVNASEKLNSMTNICKFIIYTEHLCVHSVW